MKKRIQMTLIFLCVTAFLTMLILQDHNISQEETVFQPTTEIVQREEYNQVRPVIPTLEHEFFMEEEALAYLNEALNIIQTNSYMHDEIDWVEFRERVYAEAQGATRPADTYNAIRYALRLLGDHHSRFFFSIRSVKYTGLLPKYEYATKQPVGL